MSARLDYPAAVEGTPGTVHVCGNFTTAGAASPTVFSSGPFSVARTGSGTYVVTFKENFNEFLSGDCRILDATGSTKVAYIRSGASAPNPGTGTTNASITIETQTVAGTIGDLTGPIISFDINWRKGALRK